MAHLSGYAAVVNMPTEIDSRLEGNFIERIATGAFRDTIRENRNEIRVMFEHGNHPLVGNMILGTLDELREDTKGLYYSSQLFDTSYNRELEPGLRSGQYGASFRFRAVRESFTPRPRKSKTNPRGIPERTVLQARVFELGPVAFGAYSQATATLRSDDPVCLEIAGRIEDARALPAKYPREPGFIRRLRDESQISERAAELLDAVENGRAVVIDWRDLHRSTETRVKRPRKRRNILEDPNPSWSLEPAPAYL